MDLKLETERYLDYCLYQKTLNEKTVKAYRIDLSQFAAFMEQNHIAIDRAGMSMYLSHLHISYKPKSAKRKIASLKAFFIYLEYEEIFSNNPFSKLKIKFKEPQILPKTISFDSIRSIFLYAYEETRSPQMSVLQRKTAIRNVAILELLFAAGLRVSELCNLSCENLDLKQGQVRIWGKGSKERVIQLTNAHVLQALWAYENYFQSESSKRYYFFLNRHGERLSEQSVRILIASFAKHVQAPEHITPHMFRHTFATMLLEEDVDIRYIQQILGHSSIVTTQIYTHITDNKQREILTSKHPRNKLLL